MEKILNSFLPGVGAYAKASSTSIASSTSNFDREAPTDRQNKERVNNNLSKQGEQSKSHMEKPSHHSLDFVNKLLLNNEEQQYEIEHLVTILKKKEERIEQLEERNDILQKRSSEISKHMANMMNTSGAFESIDDNSLNIDIITQFSNVYGNDWAKLSIWLAKQGIYEYQIILTLTSLMKKSYLECLCLAEEQLRQFMLLNESQSNPSPEEHEELYALRRKYAMKDTARAKISQDVLEKVLIGKEIPWFQIEDKAQEAMKMLQEFLHKYVDCCWVMVVSNPRLVLNFDVVGKQYCKEHFKVFSAKERIIDETKVTDSVCEVVWPCVYFADGSAFCAKGDALLVSKGLTIVEDSGNVDCCCFVSKEVKKTPTANNGNSWGNIKVTLV